ncbi:MAG: GNAT family N-acetyltransferase [Actinobacteria bacterium]|nr:GNAT family N-acetyltransferase [Actinomycetota bacterium]
MTDGAVGARCGNAEDLLDLAWSYRHLEQEMVSVPPIGARTNGLSAPERAVGERSVPIDSLLTEHHARGIGVGKGVLDTALGDLWNRGTPRFDIAVLPGRRESKNFFEAQGFKARSIVTHHEDL